MSNETKLALSELREITAQLASDALGDMLAESVESRIPAHGFGAIPLWCPDVAWGKK